MIRFSIVLLDASQVLLMTSINPILNLVPQVQIKPRMRVVEGGSVSQSWGPHTCTKYEHIVGRQNGFHIYDKCMSACYDRRSKYEEIVLIHICANKNKFLGVYSTC